MALDLYQDRRAYFLYCEYWKRNVTNRGDNNQLIHDQVPNGCFYAKIVNDKNSGTNNIGNAWNVAVEDLSLETKDIINISANDLVKFRGEVWLVERVNETILNKNTQFSKTPSKKTVLTLKKGN